MPGKRTILIAAGLAAVPLCACSLLTKLDPPTGDGTSDAAPPPAEDAGGDAVAADASDAADECQADACTDAPPPFFAAQYVSQSFPLATTALPMTAGQVIASYIELQNVGNNPWTATTELATTEPRDRVSPFAAPTWASPSRLARVSGTVPPGTTYKFQFDLRAPQTPGTYFEHFGLVDGTVWFGDPGQGGPPDSDIEVQVVVSK
jgi:hypothetical protein